MASFQHLPSTGFLGLRQDTLICKLTYKSSNAAAGGRGKLLRHASGLFLKSNFGPKASSSSSSSASSASSSISFKYEFPRLKDVRIFLRQCMEDFEGVIPGKINGVFERADEFGQDGRQRRRTAMAAVVFVALSLLLQHEEAVSAEAMAAVRFEIPAAFPWEKVQLDQLAPSKGTCATCIGVVDETLGACNATANCVSSFDDRLGM